MIEQVYRRGDGNEHFVCQVIKHCSCGASYSICQLTVYRTRSCAQVDISTFMSLTEAGFAAPPHSDSSPEPAFSAPVSLSLLGSLISFSITVRY
jgi:hypothetical protein